MGPTRQIKLSELIIFVPCDAIDLATEGLR